MAPRGGLSYHVRMSFLKDLRDVREMERLSKRGETASTGEFLEGFLRRHPGDARAATLLARARAEGGDFEAALDAAARAEAGLSPWAARILKAEILQDAGRNTEARPLLQEACDLNPGNVAAAGNLSILDLEERGMQGAREAIEKFPPGTIWCQAVLSRLLLALEEEMERRGSAADPPEDFHRTRSVLFRPRLSKEMFRRYWIDWLSDLLAWLRSSQVRARKAREAELRAALRAGNLEQARKLVEGMMKEDEGAGRKELLDQARHQALEIAFLENRFPELIRIHRKWLDGDGDPAEPYPAALAGYALIAEGKAQRCLEVLAPALRIGDPDAELLHIAAIAELKLGQRARARGSLRRAADQDDIAMVTLAMEEAKFLES